MDLALPLLIFAAAMAAVVWLFISADKTRRKAEYREKTLSTLLPTRMQAYERMALYLERIWPEQMVAREQMKVQTSGELYAVMMNTVQQEFNHNVAMQIYISHASWARITRAREEVIKMLREIAKETDPKASSLEMGRKVLETAPNNTAFYLRRAIDGLRDDMNGEFISA